MSQTKTHIEALIDAVINNDTPTVVELINQGANPNGALDDACVTPLHFAAQNNSIQTIPVLIEAGANIHARTKPEGQTPIEIAAINKHHTMIQILSAYLSNSTEPVN